MSKQETEPQEDRDNTHSSLSLDGQTIWDNPEDLGHFAINFRKQRWEDWLVEQIRRGVQQRSGKEDGNC